MAYANLASGYGSYAAGVYALGEDDLGYYEWILTNITPGFWHAAAGHRPRGPAGAQRHAALQPGQRPVPLPHQRQRRPVPLHDGRRLGSSSPTARS